MQAQAQAQASSGRAAIARSVADIKAATAPAAAAAAASDAAAEELAALRREVEEQERLMQGYQQENEVAMRRIKVRAHSTLMAQGTQGRERGAAA